MFLIALSQAKWPRLGCLHVGTRASEDWLVHRSTIVHNHPRERVFLRRRMVTNRYALGGKRPGEF